MSNRISIIGIIVSLLIAFMGKVYTKNNNESTNEKAINIQTTQGNNSANFSNINGNISIDK
jgi:Na+/H+-translocating membrane pyrophosphatase